MELKQIGFKGIMKEKICKCGAILEEKMVYCETCGTANPDFYLRSLMKKKDEKISELSETIKKLKKSAKEMEKRIKRLVKEKENLRAYIRTQKKTIDILNDLVRDLRIEVEKYHSMGIIIDIPKY